jgi:hypothetical protein
MSLAYEETLPTIVSSQSICSSYTSHSSYTYVWQESKTLTQGS